MCQKFLDKNLAPLYFFQKGRSARSALFVEQLVGVVAFSDVREGAKGLLEELIFMKVS